MIRDHDKSRVVSRKAASASEDGYIEYGCSKCGETYREIIPMTGEPEDEGEDPAPADDEDEAEAGDRDDGEEYEIYENPMKATKHDRTFRYKDVKKHAKTFKAITVRRAKGRVSYKVKKGDTGVLTLKKDGRIKVRKGARKGTYSLKVKVSVPETPVGNRLYLAGHDILTVTVKIR